VRLVPVKQPDTAVMEILQQFLVLTVAHVAGPNNFRLIDIGFVVHPFVVHVVVYSISRLVANQDQVFSRLMVKLLDSCGAVQISPRPCWFNSGMRDSGTDAQDNHAATDHDNHSYKGASLRRVASSPQAQVAHTLHENQIK
jgi:hypothetical protein